LINDSIETNTFPNNLKSADVNPVYKKKDRTNAENYTALLWQMNVTNNFWKMRFFVKYIEWNL